MWQMVSVPYCTQSMVWTHFPQGKFAEYFSIYITLGVECRSGQPEYCPAQTLDLSSVQTIPGLSKCSFVHYFLCVARVRWLNHDTSWGFWTVDDKILFLSTKNKIRRKMLTWELAFTMYRNALLLIMVGLRDVIYNWISGHQIYV